MVVSTGLFVLSDDGKKKASVTTLQMNTDMVVTLFVLKKKRFEKSTINAKKKMNSSLNHNALLKCCYEYF